MYVYVSYVIELCMYKYHMYTTSCFYIYIYRYHKFQSEIEDAENLKNLVLSDDSMSSNAVR